MKAKRYSGWWCPWCAVWVDEKNLYQETGDEEHPNHSECGNAVDRRTSDRPVVPTPPSKDVLVQQARYKKMVKDFSHLS